MFAATRIAVAILILIAFGHVCVSTAHADTCPKLPRNMSNATTYDLHLSLKRENNESEDSFQNRVSADLETIYATCPAYKFIVNLNADSYYRQGFFNCGSGGRHASWNADFNYCPSGAGSGAPPKAEPAKEPPAPRKAKSCKAKDIERAWTRKSDGTNISIVGMGRTVGGSGIMNKAASKRWPRHVAKFFRIKHKPDTCEWAAQCTTIHYNSSNKGYNFSTDLCSLKLSDDMKTLTASGPHGTFTRGGK